MTINYDISNKGIERLNDQFTKGYDYKYWFFKLKTYELILANTDKFIDVIGDAEIKRENVETYRLAIKADIVFTFFHMSESLFSLMCCSKSSLPWIDMKCLRFEKLCSYIRENITNGKITDEDIKFLFFHGVAENEPKKEAIISSIKFIREFLKRVGELFLDNEAYTEYKHGLRVMTTNSYVEITPENVPTPKPWAVSGNTHSFLITRRVKKNGKEETHKIAHKTISFDYELYLRLCIRLFRLIKNMFDARRQQEKIKAGEQVQVPLCLFDKENIREIFKEDLSRKFSLTIEYP